MSTVQNPDVPPPPADLAPPPVDLPPPPVDLPPPPTGEAPDPRRSRAQLLVGSLVVVALLAAGAIALATGRGDLAASTTPSVSSPTTLGPSTTTPTTDDSGTGDTRTDNSTGVGQGRAVHSLDDLPNAVVRIETDGSIRDPDFGDTSNAGAGSGFIIDPSGIAVTNNHVVTGAAVIRVFVNGEDKPRHARVLGVSECSDLALIDIEGSGYDYLNWYTGKVKTGLDVYAAGYPLDDPNFTLTRGIVSKATAEDVSPVSNIDHVIEHDANLQPGNSGGPLVTADGKVVGINYAGSDAGFGTLQFFAIAGDIARPVLDKLRSGHNVDSLGINGFAIDDPDNNVTGIWVAGVEAGTPAAHAGLLPGDVITKLAGLGMGFDGSLRDYCDVLRTKGSDRPIGMEVERRDTGEILTGELNGDKLEATGTLDTIDTPPDTAAPCDTSSPDATDCVPREGDTTTLDDATNTLTMDVPTSWSDSSVDGIDFQGQHVPAIEAAPDLTAYHDHPDGAAGTTFLLTTSFTTADEDRMLTELGPSASCTAGRVEDYSDASFNGRKLVYTDCAGGGTVTVIAASNSSTKGMVFLKVTTLTSDDEIALQTILDTFDVVASA